MLLALALALWPSFAAASSFELEGAMAKYQVTADRTLYHSNEKVYEAFGHVVLSAEGQRLSADYVWVDRGTRELKAKGNVVFVDNTTTITAAEMQFNLDTGFGSIFYGKVSDDRYSLKGQLIRKVSEDRFLTTEGEYTTCRDCAESWKLAAHNVDLTIDGYAFMDNVYVKIKDIPTLFIPYLVVPVKTKRQTGLLFPRIGTSQRHGFSFVQPLFVAIDKHQDMTLGLGKYSSRGMRFEFEHRYKSYNGIGGSMQLFRTNDRNFQGGKFRQAFKSTNEWPLHERFNIRWRLLEVGDQEYVHDFPEDMPGDLLPALESNAVAQAPFPEFFVSAEVKRYRNLLYDRLVGFDGGMVQTLPSVYFGLKERRLFGSPLLASISGRYDRFERHNGPFQDSNNNGIYDAQVDTLREANRFLLTPELSAPFRLGPYLRFGPSLQYNELRYSFHLPSINQNVSSTSKRYVLGRLEASTVLERVYAYDGEKVSRFKHTLSPFVTYNNIPWIDENKTHPFQSQLTRDDGLFDQFDIIPLSNSTNFLRLPLGNSLYYGFTSRITRKLKAPAEIARTYPYDLMEPKPKKYPAPKNRKEELAMYREMDWDKYNPRYNDYQDIWNVVVSQAYDFKEARRQTDKKRAFSFLQAKSNLSLDNFGNSIEYRFFPRIVKGATVVGANPEIFRNKHSFSTTTTWYLKNLKNFRGTRSFVRSLAFTYTNTSQPNPSRTVGFDVNWALNDFFAVQYGQSTNLITEGGKKRLISRTMRTTYSSPSECWQLGLHYTKTRNSGSEFGIDLGVNLMGTGFVGVNQMRQEGGGMGIFGGGS